MEKELIAFNYISRAVRSWFIFRVTWRVRHLAKCMWFNVLLVVERLHHSQTMSRVDAAMAGISAPQLSCVVLISILSAGS